VSIALFLLLPVKYQITLYNSNYYQPCDSVGANSTNPPCETYNPPRVLEKQQPLLLAWVDQISVSRTLKLKDATTNWADDNNLPLRLAISSMPVVTALVFFSFIFNKPPKE